MNKPKSQTAATLHMLINKRSATSIELRNFTRSSYPAARIKNLKDLGLSIHSEPEQYRSTASGKLTNIARYTLFTPMKIARDIYQKINKA